MSWSAAIQHNTRPDSLRMECGLAVILARLAGASGLKIANIELRVGEVLANTHRPAHAGSPGTIEMVIELSENRFVVDIQVPGASAATRRFSNYRARKTVLGGRSWFEPRSRFDDFDVRPDPLATGMRIRMSTRLPWQMSTPRGGPRS